MLKITKKHFSYAKKMVFLCQENSYLKSSNLKVISCIQSKNKKFKNNFEVEFDQALIFPDGGGQPSDNGQVLKIDESGNGNGNSGQEKTKVVVSNIINAFRDGERAVSILDKKVEVGEEYEIKLDFERRFDHMQQHTGQHLLSAIAEKELYNLNTTSWWLGSDICNVEFDADFKDSSKVNDKILKEIEDKVNEAISFSSNAVSNGSNDEIIIHVTNKPGAEKLGAQTRGLPDDHVGDLRVVQLPNGLDMNLCCGTHLKNLRELQACKIINFEKGKKGKVLVNFVFGKRVLKLLDFAISHQAELTKSLKCGAKDQVTKATTLVSKMTTAERGLKNTLMDLAKIEAQKFNEESIESGAKVFDRHNKDATMDYLIVLGNQLNKNSTAFITIGDEKIKNNTFGFVCMSEKLDEISGEILKIIEGKGNAKNGKMQGKCNNLKRRKEVIKLLEESL